MLFQLILLILIGAVAFFHYIHGMFSALISAILTIIAAVIAVSYHEWVASFLVGRFPDTAAAISLIVIFAAVYILMRLAFDAMVPGNVRLPVVMDKVGAGALGVLVGLIATGIIAIAAQTLPFGPDIAGYTRFKVAQTSKGHFMRGSQWQDVDMHDLTDVDSLDPAKAEVQTLWFHQDDLVLGLTNKLSDEGALSNDKSLESIHPDYLSELFGQRLGMQVGTKHTLVSTDAQGFVKVTGVYTQSELVQIEGELKRIRHPEMSENEKLKDLPKLKADAGETLLIVRTVISGGKEISDDVDFLFRFSPASIRLMAAEPGNAPPYKDYYPVATLDAKGVAITHRIDDFLLSATDKPRTIDFVFIVDDAVLKSTGKTSSALYDGTYLEVKRNGRADLSGKPVVLGPPINTDTDSIVLKPDVIATLPKTPVQLAQPPDEKK